MKIGQFEAYFYAFYIVADRVMVISKHDEDTAQYRPHNVVNEYLSHCKPVQVLRKRERREELRPNANTEGNSIETS